MTHRKGLRSSHNGCGSNAQRLDVECLGGQIVNMGEIPMRQNGTRYHPGFSAGVGEDDTLFALEKDAIESDRHHDRRIISVKKTV